MITVLKLAGLSAVLSAGLVSGFSPEALRPAVRSDAKLYQDRLSGDGRRAAALLAYADPSAPAVVSHAAGKAGRLRWIPEAAKKDDGVANVTLEIRTGSASSALVRVPVELASR